MSVVKSLWSSVQGDPKFMQKLNGWLTIFWIALIPVAFFFGWLESVTFVSALSLWALVSGHWSAWQAARVEVKQTADAIKQEKDAKKMPKRVAKEITKRSRSNRKK